MRREADQVLSVDHGDGVFKVDNVGDRRLDEQVPKLAVVLVDFSAFVELEEHAEPVVLQVELVQASLIVQVEPEEARRIQQPGLAGCGVADKLIPAAGLLDRIGLDVADAVGGIPLRDGAGR